METMNYGLINYQKQNGKTGIFWQSEQKKKVDRKFGYRSKEQKFSIRQHPKNFDRLESDEEQILTIGGTDKENEKRKPEKDFIARNRTLVKNKNKKTTKKDSNAPKNESDSLMTLTQAQLNAILASVGKVASGKEDNLRISIDSSKNEIKIESPRKSKELDYDRYSDHESDADDDKYSRDRYEKEKKNSNKKKEKKEDSIFDLLGDTTKQNRKEDVKKYKKQKDYKLFDDEEDNDNHSSYKEENKRGGSRERRRERSRERRRKRDPSRSRERDVSGEREGSREHSRDRYRDYDRKKRKEKTHDEELDDKNKVKDRGREDKSKRKERDTSLDKRKDKVKTQHGSKDGEKDKKKEKENDKEKEETLPEKVVVQNVVSPRELAGLPLALPWKHMTKAERRRLMLARMQAEDAAKQAAVAKLTLEEDERLQKEKQERKEYDKKRAEKKAREERKERDRREREKSEERERERRWEEDREREYRDRREKEERRDEIRERKERRHRDKSHERDSHRHRNNSRERKRTPSESEDYHTSNDKSNDKDETKKEVLHLPPAGPRALTLAEKKRLQWEQERKEQEKRYDPWGRPGAGAPIRTRSGNIAADYRSRQEETLRMSYEQEEERVNSKKYQEESPPSTNPVPQQNVPAAMRSSFVLGQIAPDAETFENTKEMARKQWLMDLEKQMEEKRHLQMKEIERSQAADTWADKFSSNKPATYQADPYSPRDIAIDTGRVNSAPQPGQPDDDEDRTHIRGQNVYMDPVTRKELEEKRKRLLEHQKAVMEQVQEKQLLKQREREQKMKEDMEEERKLQAERDRLQRQFEQEQMKVKMKEAKRQQEVEKLKAAMDEAHEQALREKMTKRMQHLEKGGHDVTQLKATLQEDPRTGRYPATGRLTGRELMPEYAGRNLAQISPRNKVTVVAPTNVPGLDLDMSPRGGAQTVTKLITTDRAEVVADGIYTENRILTPSQHRATHHSLDPHLPRREFGTQTGMREHSPIDDFNDKTNMNVELEKILDLASNREPSEIEILYKGRRVRVKSATKEDVVKSKPKSEKPKSGQLKSKKGEKKEKPLWNFQNKKHKKAVKQSEKDLNFIEKRKQSEMRRIKREKELLALIDLNRDIIPTEKRTPGNSRGQSPISDRGGRTPRGREMEKVRRSKSHSPENVHNGTQQSARSQSPPSYRRSSPPVPALRYRPDPSDGNEVLSPERRLQKYEDRDPLDIPLTEGEFVPFTRTIEILDPAHASSPLPLSREATSVANARKAYIKGMKPANYGKKVNRYEDRMKIPGEEEGPPIKDPILNPALVTDHPTQRQDAILQQLSSLKMNLMQRQRELETFSPTDFE